MNSGISKGKTLRIILFLALALLFALFNSDKFFFWDTISQISIPANWYYDNNFRYFFVPDEFATGHPTFAGMYLAIVWKIFGRSLLVSHFAFSPFIFGILFQLYRYIEKSKEKGIILWFVFIFTILDPTLISQLSLMTFDIIQIFLFLWCINSIIDRKPIQLSIAFAAICLTSLRGMICGGGIIIFNLVHEYSINHKLSLRILQNYVPGVALSLLFFGAFYLNKHWIINNSVSDRWEQYSEFASPVEIARNIGIFGWRLIDFGRIGIWLVFAFILFRMIRLKAIGDSFLKNTLIVALTQFIVFFPVCILYRNPFGHRYLLPIMIMVGIFTAVWIFKFSKIRWVILFLMSAVLLSGCFWVYPDRIAQGWDATPAHWPYYKIRKEMINYIESEKIPFTKVGSFFPNTASLRLIDLSKKDLSFKDDENLNCKYILFSNIFNQTDDKINELFISGNWISVKTLTKRKVYITLFTQKNNKANQ